MKPFYWINQKLLYFFFKLFYRHKVFGSELIPPGAAILAANHASFFDPPLVAASINEEIHFLARSTLFKNRLLKLIIENLNAYPVSGSAQDLNSFKMIAKLLKEDKKVLIFPEGARTTDGSLGEIKTGVAMIAIKANCPIIPVYLYGAFEVWPRQQKFFKFGSQTACVFGHPLYPDANPSLSKKEQQEALTLRLQESLAKLKEWYHPGVHGTPPA